MPRTSRPEYPQGAKDEVSQSVSQYFYACFNICLFCIFINVSIIAWTLVFQTKTCHQPMTYDTD